jgi:hypothetical protein
MKARTVLLMAAALTCRTAWSAAPLLHVMDFETGNLDQWPRKKMPGEDAVRVVTQPVRAGRYAAEFTLKKSDPMVSEGRRTELQVDDVGGLGGEYWYGFSTLIPGDWRPDAAGEVVAQWKVRAGVETAETATRSPSLALRVKGERWRITVQTDPASVTHKTGAPRKTVWQGKFAKDTWTDWVFHVRWSARGDGLLVVWKNGKRIASCRGANAYDDKGKMYFKIGLYKPSWNDPAAPSEVSVRRIYHDEVRIGGATATYADVAPPPPAR